MMRSLASSPQSRLTVHSADEEALTPAPVNRAPQSETKPAPPPTTSTSTLTPAPMAATFAFNAELNTYATLKSKVLPNETEKAARKQLLVNASLLRGVGARLLQQPLLTLGEQAAAVDLLIEALRQGDTAVAEEALMGIVSDKQVEDPALPRQVREQMAGIKGEILYYWSAHVPKGNSQMQAALPGPVSRKIWDNVRGSLESNLAESRAELEAEAKDR